MPLQAYRAKRDFRKTPEPRAGKDKPHRQPIFVIQEHHATRLHYDFRLEDEGVLKSWAVPKEPSLDPAVKRLAVRVEDHPLGYASFKGTIPAGQYGAGTVSIWDRGTYENLLDERPVPETVTEAIEKGKLEFRLHGQRLEGDFALIRMRKNGRGKENWLLIKKKDAFADGSPAKKKSAVKSVKPSGKLRRGVPRAGAKADTGTVNFTHTDKILFPDAGITKGDVLEYYLRISKRLVPYLRDRPVTLERLPEGINGAGRPHFWQKNTPAHYPDWIPRVTVMSESQGEVRYALINHERALMYLVNQHSPSTSGSRASPIWTARILSCSTSTVIKQRLPTSSPWPRTCAPGLTRVGPPPA